MRLQEDHVVDVRALNALFCPQRDEFNPWREGMWAEIKEAVERAYQANLKGKPSGGIDPRTFQLTVETRPEDGGRLNIRVSGDADHERARQVADVEARAAVERQRWRELGLAALAREDELWKERQAKQASGT